ncbi:MAG: hypothetical protein ACOY3X_05025 [Pseudomonadota bacterium]
MSTFLLLVGLSLFASGAAMYLSHAARHDPRWVAGSLVFPFVVPLYYRRHWDDLRIAGLLQSAGLAMTVAGALMMIVQSGHPEGLVDDRGSFLLTSQLKQDSGFVDSERALQLLVRRGPGSPVAGRLHGEPFRPDRVELIDGTLRLTQGQGFLPERELAVHFGEGGLDPSAHVKRAIAPGAGDVPEVYMTWRDEDGNPVTEIFRGGYRLELELAPLLRNKLSGYIQVMLPDRWESYVGGDILVNTSHLRYVGDEVDRHFDHDDTLRFIAEEYLRSRYNEGDIDNITFNNLVLDPLEGLGGTYADVTLKDGRVGHHVIKVAKNEFGWNVLQPESAAATAAAGFKDVYSVLPPEGLVQQQRPVERVPAAPVVRKPPPEREVAFEQLDAYTGQGAVVELRDGRREQGVLRGLRKERLIVETMRASGVIEYTVSASELARIRLNSGEVIRMPGVAPASAKPAAASAAVAAAAVAPVIIGDRNLTPYMNRSVKVVASDGKTTFGIFRGLNKDRLVIETMVGGGKVDYNVPADQLRSIDFASQ